MLLGLHHIAISTPDAERMLAFYRDQLGFEVVFDGGWQSGEARADSVLGLRGSSGRQLLLRIGNAYLELFQFDTPQPRAGDPDRPVCDHGLTHLCIDVDDLDDTYARLAEAGVRFHSEPQDLFPGVRTRYARDPDGNVVEIQELTPHEHPFAVAR
jgi:glyoxylase I family protein